MKLFLKTMLALVLVLTVVLVTACSGNGAEYRPNRTTHVGYDGYYGSGPWAGHSGNVVGDTVTASPSLPDMGKPDMGSGRDMGMGIGEFDF